MCLTKKASLSALIIMSVIAILIKIRDVKYDRIVAPLIICIALIQLVEYLVHAKLIDSDNAGRYIFMILWLQVLVNAITTNEYFGSTSTTIWLYLYVIVFVVALYKSLSINFSVTSENNHLVWKNDGGNILGKSWLIYIIGLAAPFLFILFYTKGRDMGAWLLLLTGILTSLWVSYSYPSINHGSLWCYSAIAFAFVAWMIGAF